MRRSRESKDRSRQRMRWRSKRMKRRIKSGRIEKKEGRKNANAGQKTFSRRQLSTRYHKRAKILAPNPAEITTVILGHQHSFTRYWPPTLSDLS